MTRDEFGLDLYETIRIVGGLLAIQDHMNVAVYRGEGDLMPVLKQRRETLRTELIPLMGRLSPGDVAMVTDSYPMVATL